jgi:hypothetical protein
MAANRAVNIQYQLDAHDTRRQGGVPAGFHLIAANRSWHEYSSCG